MSALDMPCISRVVAIGFPHHPISRASYQQCVSEDKGGFGQYLQRLKSYSRRYFLKMPVYCPTSKNQ